MNTLLEEPGIRDDVPGTEMSTTPADLKTEWLAHFDKATCPANGLAQLTVPPREPIIGDWFKQKAIWDLSSGRRASARHGSP